MSRSDQLDAALKLAQRATQAAWREMVLATRDREALDKLRNKCRRAFDRGVQRDEQKQLDEMGLRLGDRSWQMADGGIHLPASISNLPTPNSQPV